MNNEKVLLCRTNNSGSTLSPKTLNPGEERSWIGKSGHPFRRYGVVRYEIVNDGTSDHAKVGILACH